MKRDDTPSFFFVHFNLLTRCSRAIFLLYTLFEKSRANVVLTFLLLVGFHAAISPPLRRGWVNKVVVVVVVEQWNFPLQIVVIAKETRGTKTSSRDSTFFASSSVNLPLIKKKLDEEITSCRTLLLSPVYKLSWNKFCCEETLLPQTFLFWFLI